MVTSRSPAAALQRVIVKTASAVDGGVPSSPSTAMRAQAEDVAARPEDLAVAARVR